MASYQVRFSERSDRGRLRTLKTVQLPGGPDQLARALTWAATTLELGTPDSRSRVVEVRVSLVEAPVPSAAPAPQSGETI